MMIHEPLDFGGLEFKTHLANSGPPGKQAEKKLGNPNHQKKKKQKKTNNMVCSSS